MHTNLTFDGYVLKGKNKMKNTARVIVTFDCNRKCPGCCNTKLPEYRVVLNNEELMEYQEIVITGGEPLLMPDKILFFIFSMREKGYQGKMYLYTSLWKENYIYKRILNSLDGFTFTLHAECTDTDISALKNLSNCGFPQTSDFSSRLIIDKRVYDKYDLSNINFEKWNIIRKLEWKEKCDPAPNEELLVYELLAGKKIIMAQ